MYQLYVLFLKLRQVFFCIHDFEWIQPYEYADPIGTCRKCGKMTTSDTDLAVSQARTIIKKQ